MAREIIEPSSGAIRPGCSRRRFLAITVGGVAGATMASLLSACGQSAAPAAAPAKTEAQPAAPAAAPAKPAEAAKPGEKPAAQAGPGGFTGGGSLTLLMRSHFVPAYDAWLDQWAADWGAKNRVEMQVDHILAGELPAKWAAEVATGDGHDIFGFTQGGAVNVYNKQLVDVSDLAKQFGEAHGGWVNPLAEQIGTFEGTWRGIPDYFIEFGANYRKDLFDANNLQPVDTWDDLLKSGTILNQQGNPIGIAINQKSNDANNSWNGLLWSYGASYVAADGKTVTIDSPETREAVKFALELYKSTMTNEVLSWDDTANNQFLASGRGSWIQNPISSYRTIEKQNPELAAKIYISNAPAGPAGRFASVSVGTWGIMNWSKNVPAAKAFLTDYYGVYLETVKASEGYNQPLLRDFRKKPMPIIGEDPKLQILQDFDEAARVVGHPGPPTPAAAEVEQNWIIPLMIGQAVQSENVEDAVKWAAGKIDAIYARYK
ncbi:MAG: extracellular solute-binding protein [Chloroflexota bacterium]|nr:extracellular solute-binding protein [Chloroflexota bacterium]